MSQITYSQAVAAADALAYQYGVDRSEGYGPHIFPGSHEGVSCDWIISWEECPEYDWVYLPMPCPTGFYVEAITPFAIGFYPA